MDDDGAPPTKRSRHPLKKRNIGTQRPSEAGTKEHLSMLNAEKPKQIMTNILQNMIFFGNSTLPRIPLYKELIGSHLKSSEKNGVE